MSFLLTIALLLSATSATATSATYNDDDSYWSAFGNWKNQFKRTYSNAAEFDTRFSIFRDNLRSIVAHNMDPVQNFTLGLNQLPHCN